jgi:tetratricopeptide (TPR) repeat protein
MTKVQVFPLDAVRTDGWFERIGQGIGSFHALCDIVGERFFAFSMITGARITALTVARRNPDQTLVDFMVGAEGDEIDADVQRLTLPDFRRRLVAALLAEGPSAPAPSRDTDLEALQLHIGVRYLLLAPLYGYSLRSLRVEEGRSTLQVLIDGRETPFELQSFQQRIRAHVREELERASSGQKSTIDLAQVAEAEIAAIAGDWSRVLSLLGTWPAPLAIFYRTPEGQALSPEASSLIAKGLGLLGTACVKLGEMERAEEIYRLGVQYAQDPSSSADIFTRLGEGLLSGGRAGEAIGALRRAAALGASTKVIQPLLARAFLRRNRFVASYACIRSALDAGVAQSDLAEELRAVEESLGPALTAFRARTIAVRHSTYK